MGDRRKRLGENIDKFLAERRMSDGGYAPVTEQDIEQLNGIIINLINLKWGADPDGDVPVDFKLIDRTRFEPMHYQPVPYDHKATDEFAQGLRLDTLMMNASTATDALDRQLRVMRLRRQKKQ